MCVCERERDRVEGKKGLREREREKDRQKERELERDSERERDELMVGGGCSRFRTVQ